MRRKGRGEVTHIGSLFELYKKRLRPPQQSVVRVFVEIVNEVLNITLSTEDVQYNTHTKILYVSAPGLVKSEIKLHEKEVLNHLKGRLGDADAPQGVL